LHRTVEKSYSIISGETFCSLFLLDLGLVTNSRFLADRTDGRAYATVLRLSDVCLSVSLSVCDVMYCG